MKHNRQYDLSTKESRYNALLEELKKHYPQIQEDIAEDKDEIMSYPKHIFYQMVQVIHERIENKLEDSPEWVEYPDYIFIGTFASTSIGTGYANLNPELPEECENDIGVEFLKECLIDYTYMTNEIIVIDISDFHLDVMTVVNAQINDFEYEKILSISPLPVLEGDIDFEKMFLIDPEEIS